MTIRTKRRGWRSLAAILAAMLMASVLAVVAGAPAQAANTSSEALEDTNDDDVGDAREFGGRDRYDTANRLNDNFGEAEGLGNVPVAFVASGYMLVDAISVAGLAGFLDAPVLLTPSESLDNRVANFIEDYGVQTIYVLGGPAAVADSVVEAIKGLTNSPTVDRIFGDDRYATAAAVASRLGGGAAWCGGAEAAAILANGGDVSLAYAMAMSPVANRLQLPLLLTMADELPSATENFITDQNIEHVVIMGGESSVSDDVSAALTSAGVDTVTRIDGDTPAATSAALAKLSTNGCKADLAPVSPDTVALVAESGLPDGVAASPVLASSYQNGNLVPMLIVGDTLPASVSDYLAATPTLTGTGANAIKLHLNIVAIGGDAAVSSSVMDAALAAAASADDLTVQITSNVNVEGSTTEWKPPQIGDNSVVLRFSDNIVADAAPATALTDLIRDNLEINGAPARLADSTPVTRGAGTNAACDPDTATVAFATGFTLKAGDVVSLAGGAKFGDAKDNRTVAGVSVTVPSAVRDTTAPVVSVVAIDGGTGGTSVANVQFSETDLGTATGDATVTADEVTVTSTVEKTVAIDASGVLTVSPVLAVGDRITVESGALVDAAGNKSRTRTFSVLAAQASPRVTAVTMSELKHTAQATIEVPAAIAPQVSGNGIAITAKMGGAADGAAGNDWNIAFDKATGWKPDAKAAVDIDVRVNTKDRLVSVRFNTGNAKFADLQSALEGNSAFDAMFKVSLPAAASGACGATANNALDINTITRGAAANTVTTTGGMTAVAIEARFSTYVASLEGAGADLLELVLAPTLERAQRVAASTTVGDVRTALGMDTIGDVTTFNAPGTTVRYEALTSNAGMLPQVRDLVTVLAGSEDDSATSVDEDQDHIASGYAADDGTTIVNEDENDRSQVRIGRSSTVKVPS